MPKKIVRDISASTFQVIANQLLGLGIFFILTRELAKGDYGELNFIIAILTVFWGIGSFGIDLIAAKKIASGDDARKIAGIHIIHSFACSVLFILILILLAVLIPVAGSKNSLLVNLGLSFLLTYLSTPFKQLAYGKRMFFLLALMSTSAAFSRLIFLLILMTAGHFSLTNVALVFIFSSLFEFMVSSILVLKKIRILPLYWSSAKYLSIIKESLPQFGAIIFNSVLARFDWILLGTVFTTLVTADYVFAYKIFELSKLPLWIISPVLMPVFTQFFSTSRQKSRLTVVKSRLLFRAEVLISAVIPLLIAVLWLPLMKYFYGDKYGYPALVIFLILSLGVPLQYATDYYWNLCVAQGQLKLTSKIIFLSTSVNIILNLCLVPFFGAPGAACSYVASYLLQLILYKKYTNQQKIRPEMNSLLKAIACAILAAGLSFFFITNIYLSVPAVIILYFLFSILVKNLVLNKIKTAIRVFVR